MDEEDEWACDDATLTADQLYDYEREPYALIATKDFPIDYWVSKRSIWPQLAQMALDVFATPAMSDEPERVFSMAGNVLSPRRRQLKGDGVEQILCLRSWQSSGIIRLDEGMFTSAIEAAGADDDDYTGLTSSNLLYHEQIQ